MKVVLTNLSNQVFEESRNRLNNSAKLSGIDNLISWDFQDLLKTSFYSQHKKMLDQPKGLGYWVWKPFIILEAFKSMEDGDIVVYSDCGHEIIADIKPLIEICRLQSKILLFENGDLKNAAWTKRDCFVKMGCDSKIYWYGSQVDASFVLCRKSREAIRFLEEWLFYCSDFQANTSNENELGKRNLPSFIEHRWDQSILSLLAIQWKIELYRMPSQYGNHYKELAYRVNGEINCRNQFKPVQLYTYSKHPKSNSPYFQLLNHHRKKAVENSAVKSDSLLGKLITYPGRLVTRILSFLHKQIS